MIVSIYEIKYNKKFNNFTIIVSINNHHIIEATANSINEAKKVCDLKIEE